MVHIPNPGRGASIAAKARKKGGDGKRNDVASARRKREEVAELASLAIDRVTGRVHDLRREVQEDEDTAQNQGHQRPAETTTMTNRTDVDIMMKTATTTHQEEATEAGESIMAEKPHLARIGQGDQTERTMNTTGEVTEATEVTKEGVIRQIRTMIETSGDAREAVQGAGTVIEWHWHMSCYVTKNDPAPPL